MKVKIFRGAKTVEKPWSFRGYQVDWNGPTRSKFQTRVKMFLYPFWRYHNVYEELKLPGCRLSFDLYNETLRLALECQGAQHTQMVSHFHGKGHGGFSAFKKQLDRDVQKDEFCQLNNITFVEIFEKDELTEGLARKLKLI